MPIPKPHKGESKQAFLGRCSSAIYDEYKGVKGQTIAICESTWRDHKAKASLVISAAGDEYLVMASVPEKPTKLHVPENWDKVHDLSTKDFCTWCGANDWENSWSAVAFYFGDNPVRDRYTKRVWAHISLPPVSEGESSAAEVHEHGKRIVKAWLAAAKAARGAEMEPYLRKHYHPKHFMDTAHLIPGLTGYGLEQVQWCQTQAGDGYLVFNNAIPSTVPSQNSDPANDDGSGNPNSAPPAAPFPAKTAPKDSKPDSDDDEVDKDYTPNATEDNENEEYVGGRKVEPAHLPNPEAGGLDPNPDNDTNNPKGGVDQTPDSLDDDDAKPNINQLNWYMGKKLAFKVDPQTGLAKWPLDFATIEKDFNRPNKPRHKDQEPKTNSQDGEREYEEDKPYVI